jgi:hypothetical protein
VALMAGPDAAVTALAWAALAARRGRAGRERIVERFGERGIAVASVDEVLVAAGAGEGRFHHYSRGPPWSRRARARAGQHRDRDLRGAR